MQILLRTSSDVFIFNLGLHFEGLFWERYILKGQITFEGHWRLQFWPLEPTLTKWTRYWSCSTMDMIIYQKKNANLPPKHSAAEDILIHYSPTIFFEFVTIPRPLPSASTYAHPCPPIAWHVPTHAHPCPPMLFKLRPCIQKLCNVHYPPTPSLRWIGQIKSRSLSLTSARRCFLVSVILASKKFDSDLELDAKMHKTNAHPWTITSHPCPPKAHGHG